MGTQVVFSLILLVRGKGLRWTEPILLVDVQLVLAKRDIWLL